MKKLIFFLSVSLLMLYGPLAKAQTSEVSQEDLAWIEKNMDHYMMKNEIPALVVGIVREGEKPTYISRGVMKKGKDQKVNEHTIFQLASLTKSFTGILAGHMIDEGKIKTEESIISYLPETLSPETKEKLRPITVAHLLHQRSGIPRTALNGPKTPYGLPMKGDYSEAELLENLELITLNFTPGDRFEYSNFGFSLLGYLLERVSGKSYHNLVQEYIAQPYQMQNTIAELSSQQEASMATPYRPEWPFTKTRPWEFGRLVAAGGLFSTVSDLSKLMAAQMEAYRKFYQRGEANELVLTKQKQPMGSNFYGYGFMETKSTIDTNLTHLGHGGDVDGFVSNYSFSPEKKIGLVMLSSKGGRWFWELERQINKRLLGMPTPDAVEVSKKVLKKYVGEYQFKDVLLRMSLKGDQLWTQTPVYPRQKLYPASETEFFYKAFDAEFKFELSPNGEISRIVYTQNGRKTEPEKVK